MYNYNADLSFSALFVFLKEAFHVYEQKERMIIMSKSPTFKHFCTLADISSIFKKLLQKRPRFMLNRIHAKTENLAIEATKEIKRALNRTTLKLLNSPEHKKYLIAIVSDDLKHITFYQSQEDGAQFIERDNKKIYVSFGIHFYSQDIHATEKFRFFTPGQQHYASTLRDLLIKEGFAFLEDSDSKTLRRIVNLTE